jgi:hypothetical protein
MRNDTMSNPTPPPPGRIAVTITPWLTEENYQRVQAMIDAFRAECPGPPMTPEYFLEISMNNFIDNAWRELQDYLEAIKR